MNCSEMVMSPVVGALECKLRGVLEFERMGAPTAGVDSCWGFPVDCPGGIVDCPEGMEGAAGCAVEPVGAGINPMLAAIAAGDKAHDRGQLGITQMRGLKRSRDILLYSQTSRGAHNLL